MWTFRQTDGALIRDGAMVGEGYSGHGRGRNNPTLESHVEMGPIPRGRWKIQFPPYQSVNHGPLCMRLVPAVGTDVFGRSGFLIHGDSAEHPGQASLGCIVLARPIREQIAESGDSDLEVV